VTVLSDIARSTLVFEAPERRTLRVRGKDAVSWLNGLVTCDVTSVDARQGAHGLLLSKQGKIIADLEIVKVDDGLLLGLDQAVFDAVSELLDRYLVMEDAELEPAPSLRWLRLIGSHAEARRPEAALASGSIDWLRVGGVAVVAEADQVPAIFAAFDPATTQRGTDADWELLRLAHGFPKFGVDYGAEDNPHEASLERRAVSWSKGCYLGQEVVCMQDMRGRVKRRLVPLEVLGELEAPGAEVRAPGEADPVGRVTSSASDGERTFCMARLRAPFFDGSRALELAARPARIVAATSAG
jgi:tRNA-modifying protein YgfZ